ncbi:MAG: hypothetical protein LM583_07090 [Desulfurococcaceae archaeon]|jgi:ribonuclease BN (tRNA processing enzyme)|nr:hypothetical protein [Desulfurococcaceae archaeon]
MRFEVYCWDTDSHGEATVAIFNSRLLDSVAHIIDLGVTGAQIKAVNKLITDVVNAINGVSRVDIMITHLHLDHFSLIPHVLDKLDQSIIGDVYIPGIPLEPLNIRAVALELLAATLAILDATMLYTTGKGLESILRKLRVAGKSIRLIYRGKKINIQGVFEVKVIWPPIDLNSLPNNHSIKDYISKQLNAYYEQLMSCVKQLELDERFNILRRILEHSLSQEAYIKEHYESVINPEELLSKLKKQNVNAEALSKCFDELQRGDTKKALTVIHKVLNNFSLVMEYYYDGSLAIVIPGDNDKNVLNYIGKLESRRGSTSVIFMRGAHHGTHYGEYLNLFTPIITWLSRPLKRHRYREEYDYITLLKVLKARVFCKMILQARYIHSNFVKMHLHAEKCGRIGGAYDIDLEIDFNPMLRNVVCRYIILCKAIT